MCCAVGQVWLSSTRRSDGSSKSIEIEVGGGIGGDLIGT